MRRSRQSDLLASKAAFEPTEDWTRISFLDVVGDDSAPLYLLEPAYVNGSTVIAVWPSTPDYEAVAVMTWAPDLPTLELLQHYQVDWPAALSDLRVRRNVMGRVDIAPCASNHARAATRSNTELGRRVRGVLDREARSLGRTVTLPT